MVVDVTTILPALFIAASIVGMLTSIFILSVNVHSLIKGQRLNPSDLLIISLAFSNMVFVVSNFAFSLCLFFTTCLVFEDQFYVEGYPVAYVLFSNSWLSACLCFFYFVKVSNFKPNYLARLKSKINTLVPRLILGAQAFSILNSLFYMLGFSEVKTGNSTLSLVTNQTSDITGYSINIYFSLFFLLMNCYIPFLIIVVTTSFIIASLYKHICHMQKNRGEFGGPSLKIHHRTALTMTLLLIFYLFFYSIILGTNFFLTTELMIWVYVTARCLFSPIQSLILIMGNSRLKKTCVNVFSSCRKMTSDGEMTPTICT
ncbi:bitter taste receptor 36 [Xenopus tropicalis]|uniref:Taste receptor type 2 n=1 Tax=Xenopus tropicalis TaxID=8364 RepID=Q2AB49_XENTR|nr:bitter taste receptor 36 [Xenopus tropicalis]BAE80418.1 bitter taste receptor [Xenopus tropicalis]|eukprot:NP_001165493.1 bitter taste receptor 36 [Xenopus tropicalis]